MNSWPALRRRTDDKGLVPSNSPTSPVRRRLLAPLGEGGVNSTVHHETISPEDRGDGFIHNIQVPHVGRTRNNHGATIDPKQFKHA